MRISDWSSDVCSSDLDVIINGDVWKKLSPDLQAIVETAAKASLTESMTYFVAENSRALDILVNEHGVKLFTPPADYPPAFLKAANTVLKTYEEETGRAECRERVCQYV